MEDYYSALWNNHPHRIIIDWVSPNSRVLDIGCGNGQLSAWLVTRRGCSVTGVEPDPYRAVMAQQAGLNTTVGSIEDDSLLEALTGPYDAIVMADVLEHLRDPWKVLDTLHRLLAPEGHVLVSVPNVAHFVMRARLALGQFEYTDHGGLRDRTHLRFFTYDTVLKMFHHTGYEIRDSAFRWRFFENDQNVKGKAILNRIVHSRPNLLAYQMFFKLQSAAPGIEVV